MIAIITHALPLVPCPLPPTSLPPMRDASQALAVAFSLTMFPAIFPPCAGADMKFEVPWRRYQDYNMVVPGWEDLVYKEKDWVGLSTGSFLIRNSQWSLDLLTAWAAMGPKGKVRDEAGKQLTRNLKVCMPCARLPHLSAREEGPCAVPPRFPSPHSPPPPSIPCPEPFGPH